MRQLLLHWAYRLTKERYVATCKRVGVPANLKHAAAGMPSDRDEDEDEDAASGSGGRAGGGGGGGK